MLYGPELIFSFYLVYVLSYFQLFLCLPLLLLVIFHLNYFCDYYSLIQPHHTSAVIVFSILLIVESRHIFLLVPSVLCLSRLVRSATFFKNCYNLVSCCFCKTRDSLARAITSDRYNFVLVYLRLHTVCLLSSRHH